MIRTSLNRMPHLSVLNISVGIVNHVAIIVGSVASVLIVWALVVFITVVVSIVIKLKRKKESEWSTF